MKVDRVIVYFYFRRAGIVSPPECSESPNFNSPQGASISGRCRRVGLRSSATRPESSVSANAFYSLSSPGRNPKDGAEEG
jgi:hypothetical protein